MSYGGDLRWHRDGLDRVLRPFQRGPLRYPKVEREGASPNAKNHFVEFYNQTGAPSPEGLLLIPDPFWTVVLGAGVVGIPIWQMRAFCYPKFERWVDWGGDNRAFAGVLVPLTKFVTIMRTLLTPAEIEELHRQTEKLVAAPAPPRPPEQSSLFTDLGDSESDDE